MNHSVRSNTARALCLALAAALCACAKHDIPSAPTGDALYWRAVLNYRAALLSTSAPDASHLQLQVVPVTANGDTLPADDAVISFTSSAIDKVSVSATGLVTAVGVATRAQIIATLVMNGITHKDTLVVTTLATSPVRVLENFSIHPQGSDSASQAVGVAKTIPIVATDAGNGAIPSVSAYWTSSNPAVATINRITGALAPVSMGTTRIAATTTVYGVTRTDTVEYTIDYPLAVRVEVRAAGIVPQVADVGAGGTITWSNLSGQPIDITFDDTTNVGTGTARGNIAVIADQASGQRVFPIPGTYTYHSATLGSARIVVHP